MATQPLPPDDDEREIAPLSHIPTDGGAPIEALVSGTVGDRCVNCGAPLSSDQRYCVVCGERRGAARFSLPATAAATATETTTVSTASREPRRPRFGSGTTLVAGVATLLLAILVGVLIGHNTASNQPQPVASKPTVITVNGGTAPPAATSASIPASGSSSSGSAKKGKGGSAKGKSKAAKKAPAVSKKAAAAQQQAASKVLGGAHNAPPTVTVGQKAPKGTPGVNKKTGKFDGSFFGG
jgi:hypothetical protein